jgi:hypothetical protein
MKYAFLLLCLLFTTHTYAKDSQISATINVNTIDSLYVAVAVQAEKEMDFTTSINLLSDKELTN